MHPQARQQGRVHGAASSVRRTGACRGLSSIHHICIHTTASRAAQTVCKGTSTEAHMLIRAMPGSARLHSLVLLLKADALQVSRLCQFYPRHGVQVPQAGVDVVCVVVSRPVWG